MAIIAFQVLFVEMAFWKRVALLVFAMNLLPYVSGDYKLLHIFIPLLLFVRSPEKTARDWLYCLLFHLVVDPEDYLRLPINPEAASNVFFNPLIMSTFVLILVTEGWRRPIRFTSPIALRFTFVELGHPGLSETAAPDPGCRSAASPSEQTAPHRTMTYPGCGLQGTVRMFTSCALIWATLAVVDVDHRCCRSRRSPATRRLPVPDLLVDMRLRIADKR